MTVERFGASKDQYWVAQSGFNLRMPQKNILAEDLEEGLEIAWKMERRMSSRRCPRMRKSNALDAETYAEHQTTNAEPGRQEASSQFAAP